MAFFIRPRQDFTLSMMADVMRCLVCCDFYPMVHVYKEDKKPAIIISVGIGSDVNDKSFCEKAIATIVDLEYFNANNFKIIEMSPAEAATEVD